MGLPRRLRLSRFPVLALVASLVLVASLALGVACGEPDPRTYATIETDFGEMRVLLYDTTARHKANFVKLAGEGFYDSLLFHRVIPGFMIQGGDPDSRTAAPGQPLGMGGPGYRIPAEIMMPHIRGALAAARDGNPEKASSGSQFYIVDGEPIDSLFLDRLEQAKGVRYSPAQRHLYQTIGGAPQLDGEYTVFGEVVEGLDVIDRIASVKRDRSDRPATDVRMRVVLED